MNGTATMLANEMAIVARATAEPDAFAEIYDYYFPRVYNYVRYRVHDAQVADDITALIFERAWVNLKGYQSGQGTFGAWLFGIAHNAVSDYYRRQREFVSIDEIAEQAGDEPAPEMIAERNETHEHLLEAVSRLKERDRELLALKFGAGLTNVEIARMTGMSESNVGVSLYRAIQQLKGLLKE